MRLSTSGGLNDQTGPTCRKLSASGTTNSQVKSSAQYAPEQCEVIMDKLDRGIYQHYKGPLYLLIGVAHHAKHPPVSEVGLARHSESGDYYLVYTSEDGQMYVQWYSGCMATNPENDTTGEAFAVYV